MILCLRVSVLFFSFEGGLISSILSAAERDPNLSANIGEMLADFSVKIISVTNF